MNEYAGFKVGDKVKIIKSEMSPSCAPMEGVIKRFGDFKVGGFAEVDTVEVFIGESCFDICYLLRHNVICKLPKYAVGDKVRIKSLKQLKEEGVNTGMGDGWLFESCMEQFCGKVVTLKKHKLYHDMFALCEADSISTWSENWFEPFDGFRVGDTVWTAKRGKGEIIYDSMHCWKFHKERPFVVRFFVDERDRFPKLSNLIPTEAKYKAIFGAPKPHGFIGFRDNPLASEIKVNDAVLYRGKKWMVEQIKTTFTPIFIEEFVLCRSDHMGGYKAVVSREDISLWNKCIEGISHIPNTSTCGWAIGCKVEPKFKVGDVVFYNGQKWEVVGIKQRADNPCLLPHIKYDIHRQVTPNGGVGACVNESDLRAWKETKITHDDRVERCSMIYSVSDFKSLKHIGTHINNLDIFSQDAGNGKVVVWYGIKGDDL